MFEHFMGSANNHYILKNTKENFKGLVDQYNVLFKLFFILFYAVFGRQIVFYCGQYMWLC